VASTPGQEYIDRVREEVATLQSELQDDRVRERIEGASKALGVPEELGLAAFYRAARRSGLSLTQFLGDLERAIPTQRQSPYGRS